MSAYELRPVTTDEAGIRPVTALLRRVFPDAGHFTEEVLRWQYGANPNGTAVGTNAWLGDALAAHYVTIPLVAQVEGRTERGLLSLNTATHPDHQGKGLFTQVADRTYARAADEGFGFVIGVANGNSTHGFTRKLGFLLVSPLCAMIGLGRLPLQDHGGDEQYRPLWTPDALAWRLAHPAYRYTLKPERDVQLILAQRAQYGARYVLTAGRDLPALPMLSPEPKRVPARIFIGLDPAMDWRRSLYANIPMRFRPSPLNLIFKDLTGRGRTLHSHSVRFHALDFDIL